MHLANTVTTMLLPLLLRSTVTLGFRTHIQRTTTRPSPIASSLFSTANNVEVSPSNHNTTPLQSFTSDHIDGRLIGTLRRSMNITSPTPIQSHAIPLLLERHDVMASSATGSGKTIMFGLPLLQRVITGAGAARGGGGTVGMPSSLIIAPTRELAVQISEVLKTFTSSKNNPNTHPRIKVCLATGGSDTRQQRQSLPSCDILVGTPGRIVQFVDERKLTLNNINYLVIDEADRLLDLGFEKELNRISRALRNKDKQSVLCSATFPEGVQRLAADFLDPNYYFVSVGVVGSTHSKITQRFEWMDLPQRAARGGGNIGRHNKNPRTDAIIRNVEEFWNNPKRKKDQSSVIVFSNTKDGVEKYGRALSQKFGSKMIRVIHGDKEQSQRNKAIDDFKAGRASLLVATDVAARGLDVTSIGLVVQADAPKNIDTYTHRIGRTGRAGASGDAVTFIDAKSISIAPGMVDLLSGAGHIESIPAWLQGMAHVANARLLEEEMQIQAGTPTKGSNAFEEVLNEEFSGQDFRRTAAEGSYGADKDTAYRSFDEEAYSDFDTDEELDRYDNTTTYEEMDGNLDYNSGRDSLSSIPNDASFHRQEPTQPLKKAVNGDIDDVPNKSILDSLRRYQLLRFEYIGLFPFDDISPLLMNISENSSSDLTKILMVAEKPSIAKAIADALSHRQPRQRRGISRALPVYEFTTDKFLPINKDKSTRCLVRVTSVVGHVYSLGFDIDQKETQCDPRNYFSLPVTKKEEGISSKLRVVDHLKALSGESEHLVLWLDCDPEGENIAHEVIAITRRAILGNGSSSDIRRIHRAQFSAITPSAIRDTFANLQEPDPYLSRSVDARQELDLRIGVALTRLLTWRCVNVARNRFSPSTRMISYGPCQTPALSFCVDRLREIERFVPKKYWKVIIDVRLQNGDNCNVIWKVSPENSVENTRSKSSRCESSATFDQKSAKDVVDAAKGSHMVIKRVLRTSETMNPPVGLNTVALLEMGSKTLGMSPKNVMNVAEKLYGAGLISYPRTETTKYDPNGFDAKAFLREHASHNEWGKSASYLLSKKIDGRPPNVGRDCGDHPPITPLKSATRGEVSSIGGAAWRVYEFVCRNFIGSLHHDLKFTRTIVTCQIPESDEEFEMQLVSVDSLGYAAAMPWVLRDIGATSNRMRSDMLKEGDLLEITNTSMQETKQKPPKFLQEHELIREMDNKGIGTDASVAVHVSNIVDREYVMLLDETGTPLRPPLPPGKRKQNLPRQVGRYMVPTPLGACLLDLFGHNSTLSDRDSPALLSHPSIRRKMEEEVKQIAHKEIEKEACVKNNLNWFEQRYGELERSLTKDRVNAFGEDLMQTSKFLRYLQRLDAFEPKVAAVNKGQEAKYAQKRKTDRNTMNKMSGQGNEGRPTQKRRSPKKFNAAIR